MTFYLIIAAIMFVAVYLVTSEYKQWPYERLMTALLMALVWPLVVIHLASA